jgi:hypothetical protein
VAALTGQTTLLSSLRYDFVSLLETEIMDEGF